MPVDRNRIGAHKLNCGTLNAEVVKLGRAKSWLSKVRSSTTVRYS